MGAASHYEHGVPEMPGLTAEWTAKSMDERRRLTANFQRTNAARIALERALFDAEIAVPQSQVMHMDGFPAFDEPKGQISSATLDVQPRFNGSPNL